jgi:hypothetical protein
MILVARDPIRLQDRRLEMSVYGSFDAVFVAIPHIDAYHARRDKREEASDDHPSSHLSLPGS